MSEQPAASSSCPVRSNLPNVSLKSSLYWERDPAQWDLTDFDAHFVEHHQGATKKETHRALAEEIAAMMDACKENAFVQSRLRHVRKALDKSSDDIVNKYFWTHIRPSLTTTMLDETVAKRKESTYLTEYIAASIRKRAMDLQGTLYDTEEVSSLSSGEYRRKRKHSTSKRKGKKRAIRKTSVDDGNAMWFINKRNISKELMLVRDASVDLYNRGRDLPDFRELALDHVFLLCQRINESATRSFGSRLHTQIITSLPRYPSMPLPMKALEWSHAVLQMISLDPTLSLKQLKRRTAQWIVEACNDDGSAGDDDDDMYLSMFADVLHRCAPRLLRGPVSDELEDTFVHDAVTDLLDVIFGEDRQLSHQWANKELPGTDASVMLKPDFMASVRPAQRVVYLFAVEIKPPTNCSKKDICDDKVKLGKEMKRMVETLEHLKVKGPESCGLLIQGHTCSVFWMDAVYKPIYRMMEMCSFQLVIKCNDLPLLPFAVESLISCKAIVKRNARSVEERYEQKR